MRKYIQKLISERKEFIRHVNWPNFYTVIGVLSALLIYSKLYPAKDAPQLSWLFIIFVILFVSSFLLFKVYTDILIHRKKKVPTISDIRKLKLKKLKRRW